MKTILLYLLTGTALFAQVTTQIQVAGFTMPESLIGTPWLSVTNYAAPQNEAHLGVGVSYRAPRFKVDLYIYDALEKEWIGLPIKERVQKEIQSVPRVFETMVKQNRYSDVQIIKQDVQTFNGIEFTHFEVHFTDQKSGRFLSHYFLSNLKDHVLKVRLSRAPDSDPKIVPQIMQEISDAFKSDKKLK